VDGDEGLLLALAEEFLEESQRLLHDMQEAVSGGDPSLLHRAAHTIKGGLQTFGAETAHELACRLEELGRRGECAGAEEPLARFRDALGDVHQQLAEYVESCAQNQSR
jgi:HPt (histidine-containing phosphotransfer) domain-containing protein